mmetsp:Transcript_12735/g.18508  ORF Transcript_12735/g.18508 Transcript_12735/m.18508 type:complete len:94 (+) Transcript_12735:206-487(+)
MLQILDELDRDALTQEMIAEQLVAEADLAISAFPASLKVRSGVLSSLAYAASSPEPLRSPVQTRSKAREMPGDMMEDGWQTTRPTRLAARGGG